MKQISLQPVSWVILLSTERPPLPGRLRAFQLGLARSFGKFIHFQFNILASYSFKVRFLLLLCVWRMDCRTGWRWCVVVRGWLFVAGVTTSCTLRMCIYPFCAVFFFDLVVVSCRTGWRGCVVVRGWFLVARVTTSCTLRMCISRGYAITKMKSILSSKSFKSAKRKRKKEGEKEQQPQSARTQT